MTQPSAFISGWEEVKQSPNLKVAMMNENDEIAMEREWKNVYFISPMFTLKIYLCSARKEQVQVVSETV
jgi:hypothetical protein